MNGSDWVKERANCTLAKVFEALRQQVTHDVEARNSLGPASNSPRFSMLNNGESFTVLDERGSHKAVIFSRGQTAIVVRDEKDIVAFDAKPAMSDDGNCRLAISGREREIWQASKQALESLFF